MPSAVGPPAVPRSPAALAAAERRRVATRAQAAADDYVLREALAARHAASVLAASPHADAYVHFAALRARIAARASGVLEGPPPV